MRKAILRWLLRWVASAYANSSRHNASQIVDCALYLKESVCDKEVH